MGQDSLRLVAVQYVGNKARKRDTVAGTGLTWTPGSVARVSPRQAAMLLRHPMVWREVDTAAEPPARIDGTHDAIVDAGFDQATGTVSGPVTVNEIEPSQSDMIGGTDEAWMTVLLKQHAPEIVQTVDAMEPRKARRLWELEASGKRRTTVLKVLETVFRADEG